jgi:hypothetical protein
MVLQRLEGASDREACDRFAYDLRWRYAAGVVPGGPSTGNGFGVWVCAVAGCRTLPVDCRLGLRRRGLDGQGELLAGQRGGRLAASPLDPPPLHERDDVDVAEGRPGRQSAASWSRSGSRRPPAGPALRV